MHDEILSRLSLSLHDWPWWRTLTNGSDVNTYFRLPTEVTSNTYFCWPTEVTSNTYFGGADVGVPLYQSFCSLLGLEASERPAHWTHGRGAETIEVCCTHLHQEKNTIYILLNSKSRFTRVKQAQMQATGSHGEICDPTSFPGSLLGGGGGGRREDPGNEVGEDHIRCDTATMCARFAGPLVKGGRANNRRNYRSLPAP